MMSDRLENSFANKTKNYLFNLVQILTHSSEYCQFLAVNFLDYLDRCFLFYWQNNSLTLNGGHLLNGFVHICPTSAHFLHIPE